MVELVTAMSKSDVSEEDALIQCVGLVLTQIPY